MINHLITSANLELESKCHGHGKQQQQQKQPALGTGLKEFNS